MKKLLQIVNSLVIIGLIIVAVIFYNNTKKPSYQYLRNITTYIVVENHETKMSWTGSGVIVKITEDYTYILTNKHVAPLTEKGNVFVKDFFGNKRSAEVLKNSIRDDEDMSLIRITGTLYGKMAVKGVKTDARISDRVFMAGNHGAKYNIYREGVISGYSAFNYIMQLPVKGGDSGTGVVDKNGDLVGLVFALELDFGYMMGFPIVAVPNHTMSITMTGKSISEFLKDEI